MMTGFWVNSKWIISLRKKIALFLFIYLGPALFWNPLYGQKQLRHYFKYLSWCFFHAWFISTYLKLFFALMNELNEHELIHTDTYGAIYQTDAIMNETWPLKRRHKLMWPMMTWQFITWWCSSAESSRISQLLHEWMSLNSLEEQIRHCVNKWEMQQ